MEEIDWNDPVIDQAIREASVRIWQSKLMYSYWWFLCASKIFIGAPKPISMSVKIASVMNYKLSNEIPIWMENSTPVP